MARRKRELVKRIQKRFELKSYREAEELFEKMSEILRYSLDKDKEVKIPGIGIIKMVVKGGRKVKVPTVKGEIEAPKRYGLTIKEDSRFKSYFIES